MTSTKEAGCLGGSGGMVPWKFVKYRVSEIAFSAFPGINFQQFLTN